MESDLCSLAYGHMVPLERLRQLKPLCARALDRPLHERVWPVVRRQDRVAFERGRRALRGRGRGGFGGYAAALARAVVYRGGGGSAGLAHRLKCLYL